MTRLAYDANQVANFLSESNKIEGERSPLALIDAYKAWDYASRENVLGVPEILSTHAILMYHLWPNIAGNFRNVMIRIRGASHAFAPVDEVEGRLHRLVDHQPEPTEDSIRSWHIAFQRIHPFRDGNGRTGRIILNWQRVQAGLPILVIQSAPIERAAYMEWFR